MSPYEQFLKDCRLHADVAHDCYRRMRPYFSSTQFASLQSLAEHLSETRSPEVVGDALWALELRQETQKARGL